MYCVYCGSKDVVKAGKRYNKYVTKQLYKCNTCKRRFVEHDGFENMTYPEDIVTKALHLYMEGLSLSKVREYVWQHEGYYLYDGTILYWVKKYAHLLSKFEEKLKPRLKGRIHTDETYAKVKGKNHYSINSIDNETKYNIATTFTEHRTKEKCKEHFGKIWKKIGEQVEEIWKNEKDKPPEKRKLPTFVSDKFENYRNGFNYYFYRHARLVFGIPIAYKRYGLKHNNNAIERHNEDFKQRYKVMRGFKSSESAECFTELRRITYNFVRTHQGIKRTPAEKAGLNLNLGRNRLLDLIFLFLFIPLFYAII